MTSRKTGLRTRKKQRLVVLTTAVVTLFASVFLVLYALGGDSLSLFLQPSGIQEQNMPAGKHFRLGGQVVTGSYEKLGDGLTHSFVLTDCVANVTVQFKGLLPDLFREGQGIVTEGALNGDGIFTAETVLAKHDENYAPKGTLIKAEEACVHPGTEMADISE